MAKTTAAKKTATQAPGADAGDTTKPGAPVAGAEAVAGTASITAEKPAAEATPHAPTDPFTEAAAERIDTALLGEVGKALEVIEGTGGIVEADPDSEIPGRLESRPSGWVVTCMRRDRGLWRAGRFWPPEPTAVSEGELTLEQFAQVSSEKLLHVQKVD